MFKDIDLFKPAFIRIEDTSGINIIFEFENGEYKARDKEKYGDLNLIDYLKPLGDKDYSYHISLRSADNRNALLVFESDKLNGEQIIKKLAGIVRDKGLKFILKTTGNKSTHLVIPICVDNEETFNKMFDSIYYILGEDERSFIDIQLKKYGGTIRGFFSVHNKTLARSEIVSGIIENLNFGEDNSKKFNLTSYKENKNKPLKKFEVKLIEKLEPIRQERLLEVAGSLQEGERAVTIRYVASKLKDNKENKKFLEKFVKAIKNKKDFDIASELNTAINCLERNYNKKNVENTKHYKDLVKALWNKQYFSRLHKGIKIKWNEYIAELEKDIAGFTYTNDELERKEQNKLKKRLNEVYEARTFLEERNLIDLIPDVLNGIEISKCLALMEKTAGLRIDRNNYNVVGLGDKIDKISGKESEKGLTELEECFKYNDKKSEFDFLVNIPENTEIKDYGKFGFLNNGNKKFTKVYYDIETNAKQEPVLIGVLNKDLKRIVIGTIREKLENPIFEKSYKNDYEIIRCTITNGYEALFLADAETYLACLINSELRQGDNSPVILKDIISGVDINFNYVKEIHNNKRRTFWIGHNVNFDINKLNLTARNSLRHIKNSEVKSIELNINSFGYKKQYLQYSYKLGNRSIGVHFKAATKRYGLFDKAEIELKPAQKESDNYVYGLDTLIIAKALQKKEASLKKLGEEFNLVIQKGESKYKFTGLELWSNKETDIKEIEYLLRDLFVTDSVFSHLGRELDIIPELLGIIGIDKQRAEKHSVDTPYLYKIYSTASLTKLFYVMKYSENYDDWIIKNRNMKFYDNINSIYKEVYAGGRVEIFKKGLIKGDIIYSDFSSLYPHTSYLTNIEPLMNDIINTRLKFTSNTELIELKFYEMVEKLINKINNKERLEKNDFVHSAVLNISSNIDLRLSRKASIFRGEVKTDSNKRNRCDLILENSKFNTSIYDLCYAVIEKVLIDKISLEEIKKQLTFNKGLMVIPSETTNKENDLHTKLYAKRNEINKEIKNTADSNLKKHLTNQSNFIKIILNSGYGVTAEFSGDRAGQFYNPVLASSITSVARLLTNLVDISARYYGYKVYYEDTDSCFMDSEAYYKVKDLFANICDLKNELEENEVITNMFILGAKGYGYKTNKGKLKVTTHGTAWRGSGYKPVIENVYENLFNEVNKQTIIENAKTISKLLTPFDFTHIKAKTGTLYTNLASCVNKLKPIEENKYNGFSVYQYGKDSLFITDCEKITKGTFGLMFRLDKPKFYFFSVKYGFEEKELIEVITNIKGIPEEKRKLILERINNKESEKLFLERYLGKNEDNIKRKILENGFTEPFRTNIKEDINIGFNEQELSLDGVDYYSITELPDFDFSSLMEADLTTYYSKAITSMSKSLSYWLVRRNNPDQAEEVFNKRNSELLIPQNRNEIIIPIRMVEVTDNIKDKPRNTIIEETFNNKKYWFEIVSYKSNKANANIRVNVVVGKPYRLKVNFWINPTPFFNVELWNSSYTNLMFSSNSIKNVINRVFSISFDKENKNYNSILSGFSRGSSVSIEDLRKNPRYFLGICYTMACSFLIMNSIKHSSIRITRTDLSMNIEEKIKPELQDLAIAFINTQLKKEVDSFLDNKTKKDFVMRTKLEEEIYTTSNGYYCGMVNKNTRISQIVYNKSKQLSYKLIKHSRKKGFSKKELEKYYEYKLEQERTGNLKNVWRLEVQAYGFRAIEKCVNSYDKIMQKLEKYLRFCIRIVRKIGDQNLEEFKVLIEVVDRNLVFNNWFNERLPEKLKPPNLITIDY